LLYQHPTQSVANWTRLFPLISTPADYCIKHMENKFFEFRHLLMLC